MLDRFRAHAFKEHGIENAEVSKDMLQKFEKPLEKNESIYEKVMQNFNDFIKDEHNLENKTKEDLIKMHIQSIVYLAGKDIDKDDDRDEFGLDNALFHFAWLLNENQINYIKASWLKNELRKHIKVCLNEVKKI